MTHIRRSLTLIPAALLAAACGGDDDEALDTVSSSCTQGIADQVPAGRIAFTLLTSPPEQEEDAANIEADVYAIDSNGFNSAALIVGDGLDGLASWSPDGSQLLFTSSRSGSFGQWVANADGSDAQPLVDSPAYEFGGVWSPDGTHVAFTAAETNPLEPSAASDVHVVASDGSGDVALGRGDWVTWLDNTSLLVTRFASDFTGTLWRVTTDGGEPAEFPGGEGAHEASVSPNGETIAFAAVEEGDEEIFSMRADGSGRMQLTERPGSDHWPPSWSPDGTHLAWTGDDVETGAGDIFVMGADCSGQVNVTNTPEPEMFPAWQPGV